MKIPIEELIEKYRYSLYAVAFQICRNSADADDVVQDTFLSYYVSKKEFEGEEHIRAWLIRVAVNKAKNICGSFFRKKGLPLEDFAETLEFAEPEDKEVFLQVMKLPPKLRIVIHLFYYEEYSIKEIAGILHLSESNVKTRLSRARQTLREILKEEWNDDESREIPEGI